jgi:hypothetical protein
VRGGEKDRPGQKGKPGRHRDNQFDRYFRAADRFPHYYNFATGYEPLSEEDAAALALQSARSPPRPSSHEAAIDALKRMIDDANSGNEHARAMLESSIATSGPGYRAWLEDLGYQPERKTP